MPTPTKEVVPYRDDFNKFANQVRIGKRFMLIGAAKLVAAGVTDIRFPDSDLPDLRDPGDRAVIGTYSARELDTVINGLICEWKSRGPNCCFTSPADFPHPTVFIDTVNSIELKETRPHFYIFISQVTEKLVAIDVEETLEWWRVERRGDSVRRYTDNFYTCPKRFLLSQEALITRLNDRRLKCAS